MCILFYIQSYFPTIGNVVWEQGKPATRQISEYIANLGDSFENVLDGYFNEFKQMMKIRKRIPTSLVEKYYNDACFLVDTDYTYVHAFKPRIAWLKPFGYEIVVNDVSVEIISLLTEEIDAKAKPFGKYKEAKEKIKVDIKIASVDEKRKKMIKDLNEKLSTQSITDTEEPTKEKKQKDQGNEPKVDYSTTCHQGPKASGPLVKGNKETQSKEKLKEEDKIDVSQKNMSVQDHTPPPSMSDPTYTQQVQAPTLKIMPSSTIVVSVTNAQDKPSGETPSPTLALVVQSSKNPEKGKGKKKKIHSLGKFVTLDEVIEFLDWYLKNLTFEKIVILQDILERKKIQDEM